MWKKDSLNILGYKNRHIKNKFLKHDDKVELLTIIIAGYGYTINAPYLYYSKYVPFELDSDILLIDFDYSQLEEFILLPDDKKQEWFEEDLKAIKNVINSLTGYSSFWQIGKSLGTSAINRFIQEPDILKKTRKIVWITPGEKTKEIYSTLGALSCDSFVVYGTNDPYTKENDIKKIRGLSNVNILTLENADHSLGISDIDGSIEYLKIYLVELKKFLAK